MVSNALPICCLLLSFAAIALGCGSCEYNIIKMESCGGHPRNYFVVKDQKSTLDGCMLKTCGSIHVKKALPKETTVKCEGFLGKIPYKYEKNLCELAKDGQATEDGQMATRVFNLPDAKDCPWKGNTTYKSNSNVCKNGIDLQKQSEKLKSVQGTHTGKCALVHQGTDLACYKYEAEVKCKTVF